MKDACDIIDKSVKNEKVKTAFIRTLFKSYFKTRDNEVKIKLSELIDELEDRDTEAVRELIDTYTAITSPTCFVSAPAKTKHYVMKVAENRGITLHNRIFTQAQANEIIEVLKQLPKKEESKPVLLTSSDMAAIEKRLWG
jgi:hypothetical protein